MSNTYYTDLNLLSGSSDTFRTALGFFFAETDAASPNVGTYLGWNTTFDHTDLANPFLSTIWATYGSSDSADPTVSELAVLDSNAIIPNYKYPARLNGNASLLKSDEQWKTVLVGGTWGGDEYAPIFNEQLFDNNRFACDKPYTKLEQNTINTLSNGFIPDSDVVTISMAYNHYYKNYERYVNNLGSELLIPNMYLLKMKDNFTYYNTAGADVSLSKTLHNFNTRDGAIQEGTYITDESVLKTYLNSYDTQTSAGSSIAQSILMFPLSASTEAAVKHELQNVIFASDNAVAAVVDGVDTSYTVNPLTDILGGLENFPYYTQILFTTEDTKEVGVVIKNHDFGNRFMKTIKEVFTDQLDDFKYSEVPYMKWSQKYSGSVDGILYNTYANSTVTVKEVDFLKMLGYMYNNYKSTTSNCCFVEEDGLAVKAMMDESGGYRYYNSVNTLGVLTDTIDIVKSKFVDNWMNNQVWEDPWTSQGSLIHPLHKLYNNSSYYKEFLAYRVEKIGGAPTGDGLTQPTLQNFWFLNSSDLGDFRFYDNQVKYGKDYTYKVYAYVFVSGHEYQFTDLAVTRQISYDESSEEYCLEFYNPTTGERTPQLLGKEQSFNTFQSQAQVKNANQYLADFMVNIAPSAKLFEIPITEKTLQVLDNPPNQLNVVPRQFLDNSQRVGFSLIYETFLQQPFPLEVLARDSAYKENYLNALNLLEGNEIWLESVSKQQHIEVYRVDKMPHSLSDFEGNQIANINLRPTDESDRLSYVDFADRIDINRKYYYLFRVLNEEGEYGHVSDILQAELVSDGGFKYATFDTLFPSSLGQSSYSNPSIPFKKLFQLEPNLSHLTFNTEDVDFSDTAKNQHQNVLAGIGVAEDSLWGKKFKVRLTSKKTGKKIDLNITYKLNGE